jgi:predicted small lipoprotein YifL
MKNLAKSLLLILILSNLAGCSSLLPPSDPTSPPNTNQQDAGQALVDFFRLLDEGHYQQAAELYSGTYEWLIEDNPDLRPSDQAGLLERGCRQNGLMCLEVRNAEAVMMLSSKGYVFEVQFQLEDGSLFELGPCCGETSTEMPPVSIFHYRVLQGEDGIWRVTELPPYVP